MRNKIMNLNKYENQFKLKNNRFYHRDSFINS